MLHANDAGFFFLHTQTCHLPVHRRNKGVRQNNVLYAWNKIAHSAGPLQVAIKPDVLPCKIQGIPGWYSYETPAPQWSIIFPPLTGVRKALALCHVCSTTMRVISTADVPLGGAIRYTSRLMTNKHCVCRSDYIDN